MLEATTVKHHVFPLSVEIKFVNKNIWVKEVKGGIRRKKKKKKGKSATITPFLSHSISLPREDRENDLSGWNTTEGVDKKIRRANVVVLSSVYFRSSFRWLK